MIEVALFKIWGSHFTEKKKTEIDAEKIYSHLQTYSKKNRISKIWDRTTKLHL